MKWGENEKQESIDDIEKIKRAEKEKKVEREEKAERARNIKLILKRRQFRTKRLSGNQIRISKIVTNSHRISRHGRRWRQWC